MHKPPEQLMFFVASLEIVTAAQAEPAPKVVPNSSETAAHSGLRAEMREYINDPNQSDALAQEAECDKFQSFDNLTGGCRPRTSGLREAVKGWQDMMKARAFGLSAALLLLCGSVSAHASKRTEVLLYSFTGGSDGLQPWATLVADPAGNLYGTTNGNGASSFGTVFKLTPDGTLTTLYAFTGNNDGGRPRGGVVFDAAGNLYGTASAGGPNNAGVIFKIAPDGTESTFHAFGKQSGDGYLPNGDLIADAAGNFYGVTEGGGTHLWGAVYTFKPSGKEKVLYSFTGGSDGGEPAVGLARDASGNLYGTSLGGCGSSGNIFKLAPDGTETVLHNFDGDDGYTPMAPLLLDKKGNLYGTTFSGGPNNAGVIFKLAPDLTMTEYAFNGANGSYPYGGLISGKKGALYGTTCFGGKLNGGTAYKLTPDGTIRLLHSFGLRHGGPDCLDENLMMDNAGNLFGVTEYGGPHRAGTIFEIKS